MKYIIYDTTNHPVGISFDTWKDAEDYRAMYNRLDWVIKAAFNCPKRKSTDKQRRAVSFAKRWCKTTFKGDINDFYEVSDFLSDYLDIAKEIAEDAYISYWLEIKG